MDAMVSGVGVEPADVDRGSSTVRVQFDQEKTPESMAVIATLAKVMDADPVDLDPLYSTVDPDALDALFARRRGMGGDTRVTLAHEGHSTTVSSCGVVTAARAHEPPAAKNEREAGR